MISRIAIIAILFLAPVLLRAGDPFGTPFGNPGEPVDMESLLPSEEGLIRIEVSGVDARDFLARFMGDTLFIPFTSFCDFLRIKSSVSTDNNMMSGQILPDGDFEISRITNTAKIGSRSFRFPAAAIRIVAGEVYVEQSLLTGLLGLAAYYDPANLKLRISPDDRLPIVQWKRNEERYGLLPTRGRSAASGEYFPIDRRFFGAPTLNWMLANSLNGKITSTVGALYYGQQFLWGTLEVNGSGSYGNALPANDSKAELDAARWTYQMPGSPIVSQIQLGTFDLPSGSRVHGIGITNTPLSPRTGYGSYQLQGFSRPGWTVELYDGSRLVDVTKADSAGRYTFQILMGYGTLDRTTRELGPYGEIVLEQHRLQFNQGMIPAGEIEYDIRYGADSLSTESHASGSARLAYGLFDRVTLAAEAAYQTPNVKTWNADSISPRALATLWLGGATSLGLNYGVRSKLIGGDFYTIASNNATVHATLDSLSIDRRTFSSTLGANYPIGQITIGAQGAFARRSWGDDYMVEPQLSGYLGGISFIGAARVSWARPLGAEPVPTNVDSLGGKHVSSSLRVMLAPFGGLLLSAYGRYDFTTSEMAQFELSSYYQFNEHFGLNVNYSAPKLDWKQGMLQAQVSVNLRSLRAIIGTFHQDGNTSTSSFAQGGAFISTHGVKFFADPVVGQSAVLVDAFNDRNSNGVRDDGEELLSAPKARMLMAGSEMVSEDGMFRLLPANRECQVEIDRWSYASEDLYPSRTHYKVYTLPSGVHAIEVPFSRGYDLSGRCGVEADAGKTEVPAFLNGLRVQLHAIEGGATYDGEVFSDGTIFVPGVAAGTYSIHFDEDQLAARRLCPSESIATFTVTATEHRIPLTLLKKCAR